MVIYFFKHLKTPLKKKNHNLKDSLVKAVLNAINS